MEDCAQFASLWNEEDDGADSGEETAPQGSSTTIPELYRKEQARWGKLRRPFVFDPGTGARVDPAESVCMRMERGELPLLSCVNCVTTFSLGIDYLDLLLLCQRLPHTELDHRRFSAAMMRTESPASTILLFESGNGVCTGPTTPVESLLVVHQTVNIMQLRGFGVRVCNFQTQNIVSKVDFGADIDLEKMADHVGICAHYEPHMFPGLVFRPRPMTASTKRHKYPKTANADTICRGSGELRGVRAAPGDKEGDTSIVVNVFHTGKAILTGGRCAEEILQVYGWFYDTVNIRSFFAAGQTNSAQYMLSCRSQTATTDIQRFIDDVRSNPENGATRTVSAGNTLQFSNVVSIGDVTTKGCTNTYKCERLTDEDTPVADWSLVWKRYRCEYEQ